MPKHLPATWPWYLHPEIFPILGLVVAKTAISNKYLMLVTTLTPFVWVFNFIWLRHKEFNWFGAFQTTFRVKSNITDGTKVVPEAYTLFTPDDMGKIGLMLSIYFGLMFSFYFVRKYVFGIIWWKKGDEVMTRSNYSETAWVRWVQKGWDWKTTGKLLVLWLITVLIQGVIPVILFQGMFQWPAKWLWNEVGTNKVGNPWNVLLLLVYWIVEYFAIMIVWWIWGGWLDRDYDIMLSHYFSRTDSSKGWWNRSFEGLAYYAIYEFVWHVEILIFTLYHSVKLIPYQYYFRTYVLWFLGVIAIVFNLGLAIVVYIRSYNRALEQRDNERIKNLTRTEKKNENYQQLKEEV